MKTLSFGVDDELALQFSHALSQIAAQMGVAKVSTSVILRRLIQGLVADPRPPFEAGWMEGYQAGYGAVMSVMLRALNELKENPTGISGLGVGLTSNVIDAAPSR